MIDHEYIKFKSLKDEIIDTINKYWTFDSNQCHTHTWHDKQDCLEIIRELLSKK